MNNIIKLPEVPKLVDYSGFFRSHELWRDALHTWKKVSSSLAKRSKTNDTIQLPEIPNLKDYSGFFGATEFWKEALDAWEEVCQCIK